jgi:hypothetical protein
MSTKFSDERSQPFMSRIALFAIVPHHADVNRVMVKGQFRQMQRLGKITVLYTAVVDCKDVKDSA